MRRRAFAFVCVLAVASSAALGGAIGVDSAAARAAIPSIDGRAVFTVTDGTGEPGDLFLADAADSTGSSVGSSVNGSSTSSSSSTDAASSDDAAASHASADRPLVVTQVEAGKRDIPLHVDVTYSLDGPNVDREAISGATGVVGVHVRVGETLLGGLASGVSGVAGSGASSGESDSSDGGSSSAANVPLSVQRFLVVFTVPTRVADDVTVSSDESIIGTQGSNTLIAAVVRTGERVDCYMNAKKFTMGPVAVVSATGASALASMARAMGDGSATFVQPGADGASAASSASSPASSSASSTPSSGRYQRLIDQLAKLRDLERSLASSEIAAKQDAYDTAFHAYMAAYVGSYTNHLSGSIGTSTQLTALMGTAGELSGDTPLAKAVLGEANATDALASAHQHTGAADAIEQVIRMVRAQGVDGLAATLRRRAGEEETEGAKEYSAGQSQLSQAMIPYSMAYTDAYTKHLSDLTGGTSSGAAAYRDQAIAATDKEFASGGAHAGDAAKVDAALSALAAARERTGAAAAYRQIVLRFADDLNGVGTVSVASSARTGGVLGVDDSLAARAEVARLKRQAAAERKAASASSGDVTTTVVDESAAQTDSADVMKFAGGIPGAGKSGGSSSGGASKSGDASSSGSQPGSKSGSSGSSGSGTSSGRFGGVSSASAAALTNHPSPYFGMIGMNPGPMLTVDTDGLINDTTTLSDAGDLIAAALGQGADKLLSSTGATSPAAARFLIVEPEL